MNFKHILVSIGPRLIGTGVTALAGWIYSHSKGSVVVDQKAATQMIVGALAVYAASHRAASALINPGDAAKGRIAEAEKAAAETGGTPFIGRPE